MFTNKKLDPTCETVQINIRVPDSLKKRMDFFKGRINWSWIVRESIERLLRNPNRWFSFRG
jgi:hypothetical protein